MKIKGVRKMFDIKKVSDMFSEYKTNLMFLSINGYDEKQIKADENLSNIFKRTKRLQEILKSCYKLDLFSYGLSDFVEINEDLNRLIDRYLSFANLIRYKIYKLKANSGQLLNRNLELWSVVFKVEYKSNFKKFYIYHVYNDMGNVVFMLRLNLDSEGWDVIVRANSVDTKKYVSILEKFNLDDNLLQRKIEEMFKTIGIKLN